jgi:NAD(P)-dependent dehydrogenase (short-subunit alcohol dehydrogenase family)
VYKAVLVTGASGGVGEATAVHLAHQGFRVFAAARRLEKMQALSGIAGGRITPIALDVTDDASVAAAMKEIADKDVTLYGLVNCAGVSVAGPVEQVPLSEWRRQFETNVFGLVRVTQAVLPQMREAGRGRVVHISSVSGRMAPPFMGPYAASKHAVEGLSDALRREVAPHGIKVVVVQPGFILTGLGAQTQEGFARYMGADSPYLDQLQIFKAWHAKSRLTAPAPGLVAEAVLKALTASRPFSRYAAPASASAALALRNAAPAALADWILERVTGLNKYKRSS